MTALSKTFLLLLIACAACNAFSPKGSAATPLDKKKVAVIGGGGYMGANAIGFLQRAGAIYDTGIARQFRCIGATKITGESLNSLLSKHFILAQADETFIKLTNLQSVKSIAESLAGYDAVILGNSMVAERRPVTAGTWGVGPNDKTVEVFWDTVRGKLMSEEPELDTYVNQIIYNTLEACKMAGIQKIVAVATPENNYKYFCAGVESCGVPYTLLQCEDVLLKTKDYNYRKGIQGNVELTAASSGTSQGTMREDLAALSVACLTSLDWSQSQVMMVETNGQLVVNEPSSKRADQEWCVNSDILAAKLSAAYQ